MNKEDKLQSIIAETLDTMDAIKCQMHGSRHEKVTRLQKQYELLEHIVNEAKIELLRYQLDEAAVCTCTNTEKEDIVNEVSQIER